jgi:hypothetical protein
MAYVHQEYPKVIQDQHGEPVTVKSVEEEARYKSKPVAAPVIPSAADLDAVAKEQQIVEVTAPKAVRILRGSRAK